MLQPLIITAGSNEGQHHMMDNKQQDLSPDRIACLTAPCPSHRKL